MVFMINFIFTVTRLSPECLFHPWNKYSMNLNKVLSDGYYKASQKQIQQGIEELINSRITERTVSFTLTTRLQFSETETIRRYKTLIHRVSKRVYKNTYKRHRKTIDQIAVIESTTSTTANRFGDDKKFHIHGIAQVPSHVDTRRLQSLIEDLWFPNGYAETKIQMNQNGNWGRYLSKFKTKSGSNIADSIILVD